MAKRKPWEEAGFRCPYLDTINRLVLDFDFEKACSVSGNNFNVYACLVCGKYFQGRGKHTQCYTHALQEAHHVYMNLGDGRVYCLPDGYEVIDSSLKDIQDMLDPSFTPEAVSTLDSVPVYARGVDGSDYMPGLIGLNNIKGTDSVNVVVQSLARVPPLRDFFLLPSNYAHLRSPLVAEFGALVRKIWCDLALSRAMSRSCAPRYLGRSRSARARTHTHTRRRRRRRRRQTQRDHTSRRTTISPYLPIGRRTTSRARSRPTSCCKPSCPPLPTALRSASSATRWTSD